MKRKPIKSYRDLHCNQTPQEKAWVKLEQLEHRARSYAPIAFDALIDIAKNGKNEAYRLAAAKSILDRAFGRAKIVKADTSLSKDQIIQEYQEEMLRYSQEGLAVVKAALARAEQQALEQESLNQPSNQASEIPRIVPTAPQRDVSAEMIEEHCWNEEKLDPWCA
jgi:hypothetical protein